MNQVRILYINDLKDCEAARRLVGKSVLCSNSLDGIFNGVGTIGKLEEINARNCSFKVNDAYGKTYYCRFIREVIEDEPEGPQYEPYDLSNPAVRKSLRDRWIIWNDGDEDDADEAEVIGFIKREGDPWEVKTSIGSIDAAELMKFYVFDDGTPCGQLVHAGEGHVEGNASERRD